MISFLYFLSCEGATQVDVYISDYNYYNEDEGEFIVTAEEIIMHPNYGADNAISNDICLLRVPTLSEQKPRILIKNTNSSQIKIKYPCSSQPTVMVATEQFVFHHKMIPSHMERPALFLAGGQRGLMDLEYLMFYKRYQSTSCPISTVWNTPSPEKLKM